MIPPKKKKAKIIVFASFLAVFAALPWIPFYHYVAIYPGKASDGGTILIREDYFYSAFENLEALFGLGASIAIVVALEGLLVASAIFIALDFSRAKERGKYFFIASCIAVFAVMVLAAFGARCY